MFTATATGTSVQLSDLDADAHATIVPARGGIVTHFRVGERELLYLDPATLEDPSKNVRGGVPLLFPSPGRLTGDRFSRDDRAGSLPQHGFARSLPWEVTALDDRGGARVGLALRSGPATAAFPWRFSLGLDVCVRATELRLSLVVANEDPAPMPFAFGVHPYFRVVDKVHARIPTPATRAFDNVAKREVDFRGFDLAAPEVDLHLVDHGSSEATLELDPKTRVRLRCSPEMTRWVVWTLAGRDFVCLEPWSAPADALNTGESLLVLAPGARRTLDVAVSLERGS